MNHREVFTGRRIHGTNGILWYIYLQFYHKNQRIYVGKYTVRPMDPMGLWRIHTLHPRGYWFKETLCMTWRFKLQFIQGKRTVCQKAKKRRCLNKREFQIQIFFILDIQIWQKYWNVMLNLQRQKCLTVNPWQFPQSTTGGQVSHGVNQEFHETSVTFLKLFSVKWLKNKEKSTSTTCF